MIAKTNASNLLHAENRTVTLCKRQSGNIKVYLVRQILDLMDADEVQEEPAELICDHMKTNEEDYELLKHPNMRVKDEDVSAIKTTY